MATISSARRAPTSSVATTGAASRYRQLTLSSLEQEDLALISSLFPQTAAEVLFELIQSRNGNDGDETSQTTQTTAEQASIEGRSKEKENVSALDAESTKQEDNPSYIISPTLLTGLLSRFTRLNAHDSASFEILSMCKGKEDVSEMVDLVLTSSGGSDEMLKEATEYFEEQRKELGLEKEGGAKDVSSSVLGAKNTSALPSLVVPLARYREIMDEAAKIMLRSKQEDKMIREGLSKGQMKKLLDAGKGGEPIAEQRKWLDAHGTQSSDVRAGGNAVI